jgi:cystathionine beta-lyase/cystathionine gamma-synthase
MPHPSLGSTNPLVPPLYQSSVYTFADLDALDRVYNAEEAGFIYARDSHPNAKQLADAVAELEGAAWGLICGSGMAAISACVLALVKSGDRITAANRLYGRTNQLLRQELTRFGVAATFVDAGDLDAVRAAIQPPTRLLLVETMSNPMLRMVDVAALAELCREARCRLVVDNTFPTPVLMRPIELGADLVVESLTKMMGGHGDITLGSVAGRDPDLLPQFAQVSSIWGLSSNPFDCWLALRGLATLDLRIQAASSNAAALADWLALQPSVARVIYPGHADHPEHALAMRMFPKGMGNMLCFELAGGREAVNRFMRLAPGIAFSPSLGSFQTTCSHPATTSHRYESPVERVRQGITDGLIRLSVGIEPLDAIRQELAKGLV